MTDVLNASIRYMPQRPLPLSQSLRVSPPPLPVETWDHVIDYLRYWGLWDDLAACSLVCRRWRARSQSHLARRVRLLRRGDVVTLSREIRSGIRTSDTLKVTDIEVTVKNSLFGKRDTISHLGTFVPALAGRFANLMRLYLKGDWPAGMMHQDFFIHLSAFSSITHLSLVELHLPNVSVFGRMVCALPNLVSIKCHRCTVTAGLDVGEETPGQPGIVPPRYAVFRSRSLKLQQFGYKFAAHSDIMQFMTICGWNTGLEDISLDWSFLDDPETPLIAPFLAGARESLRSLTFAVAGPHQPHDRTIGSRRLTTLTIWLAQSVMRVQGSGEYWMARLLSHIKSEVIRDVTIVLDTHEDSWQQEDRTTRVASLTERLPMSLYRWVDSDPARHLSKHRCSQIEDVLLLPQYATLERVVVEYRYRQENSGSLSIGETQWSTVMQARFPRLYKQGLLFTRENDAGPCSDMATLSKDHHSSRLDSKQQYFDFLLAFVEVWEEVFDCLYDWVDYESLQNCSAVCKQWRQRCLLHLQITTLVLSDREQVARVAKATRAGYYPAGSIQEVVIGSRTWQPIPHLNSFVAMFANRSFNVKQIAIQYALWRAGDVRPDVFLHLSAFTSVVRLSLGEVAFPDFATLRHLIYALPSLQGLGCWGVTFSNTKSGPLLSSACSPAYSRLKLTKLRLCGGTQEIEALAHFFVDSGISALVHDLLVTYRLGRPATDVPALSVPNMQRMLQSSGTSLRTVHIDVVKLHRRGGAANPVLFHNGKLESIKLRFDHIPGGGPMWYCSMLAGISSPRVTRLHLVYSPQLLDSLKEDPHTVLAQTLKEDHCAQLEGILNTKLFARLHDVVLELRCSPQYTQIDEASWSKTLNRWLPGLHGRGILRTPVVVDFTSKQRLQRGKKTVRGPATDEEIDRSGHHFNQA
ncbi:hypothetical protein POSPLADRAFT_1036966 [Postia placenta MAD-698-R-SB12]|uniref:F-box domain-containing protein n=1 Tax=Postia placenta MAD-698-R-SB12 TaxID=670580 RepID=A0A1X6MLM4_9APHY|nr:hypothetical protein POSPLADRAFT_1036966 [Postia placenta MAD-698-R-SB12]OSX57072.1 hypothetical protein POSPLADRAFT_1036966 [Postia placenta MAD-698-R-SB12]